MDSKHALDWKQLVNECGDSNAQITNGFVVGTAIPDNSCGYTNAPIVLILGGGGTGAKATTVVWPALVLTISGLGSDPVALQMHDQFGVHHVIQKSTDAMSSLSFSTNLLMLDLLTIANSIASGSSEKFWKAIWQL